MLNADNEGDGGDADDDEANDDVNAAGEVRVARSKYVWILAQNGHDVGLTKIRVAAKEGK